jgi:hypothetical protein
MQSIATVTPIGISRDVMWKQVGEKKGGAAREALHRLQYRAAASVTLGRNDFPAAIETIGADVVTQMHLTGRRFDRERGGAERVVRTAHAAARGGLLVLLNGHD